jgi:TonB-dependent SusC/RagA subfamily outer membrane receptor
MEFRGKAHPDIENMEIRMTKIDKPIISLLKSLVVCLCVCGVWQTNLAQTTQTEGEPQRDSAQIQSTRIKTIACYGSPNTKAPLYIIDGVIISPDSVYGVLQTLDPATIESVNVVMDSVARSIFHRPEARGIVLITTKKKEKRPRPRGIVCVNSLFPVSDCPLYIVDGVAIPDDSIMADFSRGRDPLHRVDPKEIASVEILKDPDARAIYGTRGECGVVLITTKKRKKR